MKLLHENSATLSEDWLKFATENASIRSIAARIGTHHRTLTRHLSEDALTLTEIIAICRNYDYPIITALLDLETIDIADIKQLVEKAGNQTSSLKSLTDEIVRREGMLRKRVEQKKISSQQLQEFIEGSPVKPQNISPYIGIKHVLFD